MSAGRRRGLVLRGRSLCQWDGERYVRCFSGRRAGWVSAVDAMAVGTAREPVFFDGYGDGPLDAPELVPGGAMLGDGMGGFWFQPTFRGGE